MKTTAAVFSLLLSLTLWAQTPAPRGDFNLDDAVNTTDIAGLSDFLLGSGAAPGRTCAVDVDADSAVSSMDALRLIDYVVAGGQAPPAQPSEICDGNDNDCDGQVDEGFDVTADANNCGSCGTVCLSTNSVNTCVSGQCSPICNDGFATCDGDPRNGCETALNTNPSCLGASYIGPVRGDEGDDLLVTTGRGERWVQFRLVESLTGSTDLRARVRLLVPSGVNYDLRVLAGSCGGAEAGSSATTTDESVSVLIDDPIFDGRDDSTDYFVEIIFAEGSSCDEWTLTVQGNAN